MGRDPRSKSRKGKSEYHLGIASPAQRLPTASHIIYMGSRRGCKGISCSVDPQKNVNYQRIPFPSNAWTRWFLVCTYAINNFGLDIHERCTERRRRQEGGKDSRNRDENRQYEQEADVVVNEPWPSTSVETQAIVYTGRVGQQR